MDVKNCAKKNDDIETMTKCHEFSTVSNISFIQIAIPKNFKKSNGVSS